VIIDGGDLIVLWQREKVRPATFTFMTSAHQCSSRQSSHLLSTSSLLVLFWERAY
jgi:hypothetical protein